MKRTAVDDTETTSENEEIAAADGSPISYVHTQNIPSFLEEHRFSLLVSTYQAGRVLLFTKSTEGNRLSMLMRKLERPTGVALRNTRLAIATKDQVWTFRPARNVNDGEGNVLPHDLVWLPRESHVTGFIDAHQIEWFKEQLIVVNTRYSCLCTLDSDWSFRPFWKPPFISAITPEDRCHLNGVALDDSGPRYVTALGQTDTAEGWREKKASGGIVFDVSSGKVLTSGLSMPHSPRLYAGRLWVLESGTGSLLSIDQSSGEVRRVMKFAGFLRGLTFYKQFAFVGLCKAREKEHFGSLPIEEEFDEFECGVSIVDLERMQQVGFIHFQSGIEELFDIVVMPEMLTPSLIGFEDESILKIKIYPPV